MPLARAWACNGAAVSIACKAATAISDRNWVRIGTPQKDQATPGNACSRVGRPYLCRQLGASGSPGRRHAASAPPCRENMANGLRTTTAPKVQSKAKNISSLGGEERIVIFL